VTFNAGIDLLTMLAPAAIAILSLTLLFFAPVVFARRRAGAEYRGAGAFILAFATLGVTTGFSTAHSREPAVAAVMPALLALISGVLTYAVTREGLAHIRPVLPLCIAVLCFASLTGLGIGSTIRGQFDDADVEAQLDKLHYERVELECEKVKYLAELEVWKHEEMLAINKGKGTIQAKSPIIPKRP